MGVVGNYDGTKKGKILLVSNFIQVIFLIATGKTSSFSSTLLELRLFKLEVEFKSRFQEPNNVLSYIAIRMTKDDGLYCFVINLNVKNSWRIWRRSNWWSLNSATTFFPLACLYFKRTSTPLYSSNSGYSSNRKVITYN
jgi:hypothetical protein